MGRKPWWLALLAVAVTVGCQNSSGSRRTSQPTVPSPNLSANPSAAPGTNGYRSGNPYAPAGTTGWNDRVPPGYVPSRTATPGALPPNPNNPASVTPQYPNSYPEVPGAPGYSPNSSGAPVQQSNYNQPVGPVGNSRGPGTSPAPPAGNSSGVIPTSDVPVRSNATPAVGSRSAGDTSSGSRGGDTVPLPPLPSGSSGSGPSGLSKPNGDAATPTDSYVRTTMPPVPAPPGSASPSPMDPLAVPAPAGSGDTAKPEPVFPSAPPPPPLP